VRFSVASIRFATGVLVGHLVNAASIAKTIAVRFSPLTPLLQDPVPVRRIPNVLVEPIPLAILLTPSLH
jgi:hypothetical protein